MRFRNNVIAALVAVGALGAANNSRADFLEGIQVPKKHNAQMQIDARHSQADKFTDKNGNKISIDNEVETVNATLKLKGIKEVLGTDIPYFLSANAPFISITNNKTGQHAQGLGDASIDVGFHNTYNLGKRASLSGVATVGAKLPTGNYDQKSKMNLGTGTTDYSIATRLTALLDGGRYSLDGRAGYTIREGDVPDRTELSLTSGIEAYKGRLGSFRIGPEITWQHGSDLEKVTGRIIGRFTDKDSNQIQVYAGQDISERNAPESISAGVTVRFSPKIAANYLKNIFSH